MTEQAPNLVLTGFMATGKSSAGRAAAQRLGRPFIDMDAVLVERLGAPIADVFARYGEAHFRQAEGALCRELSSPAGAVIATGGGTIVSVENRLALSRGGLLVCLTCSPQEALRRIGDPASRPMLNGGDPAARLSALLAERAPAYDAVPRQIDTSGLTVEQIVDRVVALYERDSHEQRLPVQHDRGAYDIVLGDGVLGRCGELLRERGVRGQVAVVTNTVVGQLWAERVVGSLEAAGLRARVLQIADGEQAKTLATIAGLYDQLAEMGLERGDVVLGLGGGVVGDMAGFAAATYLRGVPYVQAPTTVLAMVDSSVGGKTGVDHARGKNLIGAFKQPIAVLADTAALLTLPTAERRAGLAEVIKHGLIAAHDILEHVEGENALDLPWLIERAVMVKIGVVQEDPYEQGRRAELNLGHTFGHALEVLSGYRLRHGEAVSIGMVIACRLAARLGLCAPELATRMEDVLRKVGLPVRHAGHAPEAIWAAMASDKKRKDGRLRFVLPRRVGEMVVTDDVPQEAVLDILRETGE